METIAAYASYGIVKIVSYSKKNITQIFATIFARCVIATKTQNHAQLAGSVKQSTI
jgi:hypothetical protein